MPAEVIQCAHALARTSLNGLTFTDSQNQPCKDDDDKCDPDNDNDDNRDDLSASIAGVDDKEIEDLQAEQDHHQTTRTKKQTSLI